MNGGYGRRGGPPVRQPFVNRVGLRMGLHVAGEWCDRGGGRLRSTDLVWQGLGRSGFEGILQMNSRVAGGRRRGNSSHATPVGPA